MQNAHAMAILTLVGCGTDATVYVTVSTTSVSVVRYANECQPERVDPDHLPVGACQVYDDIAAMGCRNDPERIAVSIERGGNEVTAFDPSVEYLIDPLAGDFLGDDLIIEGDFRITLPSAAPGAPTFTSSSGDPVTRWSVESPTQALVVVNNGLGGVGCRVPAGTTEVPYPFLPVPQFDGAWVGTETEQRYDASLGQVVVRATSWVGAGTAMAY